MFADHTNFFKKNIPEIKYSFFLSSSYIDTIPLRLPKLTINNVTIRREPNMKFLGITQQTILQYQNNN